MTNAKIYTFSLTVLGEDITSDNFEDVLFESGCDDALINYRNGAVFIDFDRESINLESAVLSAINDIEDSGLNICVVNVSPEDIVTESEIAKRLNIKRQTVSLWVKGERRAALPFPAPIMKLSEKSPLWHWYDITMWMAENGELDDMSIVDDAKFLHCINLILPERRLEKKYCKKLTRKLPSRSFDQKYQSNSA